MIWAGSLFLAIRALTFNGFQFARETARRAARSPLSRLALKGKMHMKGWKTVAFGLVVAIGPAIATYLAGIDWTSLGVSPGVAGAIGVAIIALRAVTNTPIGGK